MKDLIEYIDFGTLSEDYDLKYGDLSPGDHFKLEEILSRYILTNKE